MLQLTSLPPGVFTLETTAEGFAPARVFPIEIFEGSESALRKVISLQPPMKVALQITPAMNLQKGAWRVDVRRASDFNESYDSASVFDGRATLDGRVEMAGQSPGRFEVLVRDGDGNRLFDERMAIDSEAPVPIEIVAIPIKGIVRAGGTPLSADLWFGGVHGAVAVKMHAENDGAFGGFLPRGGQWRVQVLAPARSIDTPLDVDVSESMSIDLPANEVTGTVTDALGGPVATAEVTLRSRDGLTSTHTLRDGTFRIASITEGSIRLAARDLSSGRRSDSVSLEIGQDEHRAGVQLQLQPNRRITGRLMSRGRPVVGGQVGVFAYAAGAAHYAQTVSDTEGAFDIDVPESSNRALMIVEAPGRVLQAFNTPISDADLDLEVAPAGGTLVLLLPKNDLPLTIAAGDTMLPLGEILNWAEANGAPLSNDLLRVPNLAPGPYRACVGRPKRKDPRCATAVITVGSEVQLDLRNE